MSSKILKLFFGVVLTATACQANLVTCRPCLGGNDSYDWTTNFGPAFSPVFNDSVATSSKGVTAIVSFDGGDHSGNRVDQTAKLPGWFGNFTVGDEALNTGFPPGNGPLSFSFSRTLFELGANIQTDFFGPFTAQLCDSNGMCVTENGESNSDADGSAIFIGLRDPVRFTSAVFSVTECAQDCADFAINQLDVVVNPEPSSIFLSLVGLGLVALKAKRTPFGALKDCSCERGLIPAQRTLRTLFRTGRIL